MRNLFLLAALFNVTAVISACGTAAQPMSEAIHGSTMARLAAGTATPSQCPTGGDVLQYGVDKNGNGILDSDEVTGSFPVCNGPLGPQGPNGGVGLQGPIGLAGPQGPNGVVGPQGPNGLTGIVSVTGSATPLQCPNGGTVLQYGIDKNGNGVLDSGEVAGNFPVCDGTVGPQGPNGIVGPQGPNGVAGPQGPNGVAGVQGPQGASGPGLYWKDSNNQVMPFVNVYNPNGNILAGISGQLQDANGIWWSFSFNTGTGPGSGFQVGPINPNVYLVATSPSSPTYYAASDCSGTGYVPWWYQQGFSVTSTANAGDANFYASAVQPTLLTYNSYHNSLGCTVQTGVEVSVLPQDVVIVQPPSSMGIPPYYQFWVE